MSLSLIVAVAENGVIGRDGSLPWHLPADLQRFKRLTMGHHLIMGRKTFASLPRVLPGRISIVLSRQAMNLPEGVQQAADWESALRQAAPAAEIFVIGGAQVYAAALPHADRVYLTQVQATVPGDVYFPALDPDQWRLVEEESHPADERHAFPYTFTCWERRLPTS